jgi:hypothetical protein
MTDLWPHVAHELSSATAGAIHSHHVPLDDAAPKHSRHGAHAGSGPKGAS